jgi:hypothetical protein
VPSIAESRLCDLPTRFLAQGLFGGEDALRTAGLGHPYGASPGESGGALSELGWRGVASDVFALRLLSQAFSDLPLRRMRCTGNVQGLRTGPHISC